MLLQMNSSENEIPVIRRGYSPGLLGRIVQLHASYYSKKVSFGLEFETLVACDMAAFLTRINRSMNATWFVENNGEIAGGISIDGEDLRWFIVDYTIRGAGFGNGLMEAAMDFVREQGFKEVHLWTFDGLKAARALYEKHGFALVEENLGQKWGIEVLEQKFVFKA
ncbi:MAG: GNAT family N-acetyltransferase [Amylibacter sp.]